MKIIRFGEFSDLEQLSLNLLSFVNECDRRTPIDDTEILKRFDISHDINFSIYYELFKELFDYSEDICVMGVISALLDIYYHEKDPSDENKKLIRNILEELKLNGCGNEIILTFLKVLYGIHKIYNNLTGLPYSHLEMLEDTKNLQRIINYIIKIYDGDIDLLLSNMEKTWNGLPAVSKAVIEYSGLQAINERDS